GNRTSAARPAASAAGRRDALTEHGEDEGNDAYDDRGRQRSGNEPCQRADDAAGGNRADQSTQRGPQDDADDNDPQQNNGIERIDMAQQAGTLLLPRRRRGQRLAVDHPDDAVYACGNPAGKIPAPEFRRDDFVDDAFGGGVVERAFKAVADFDAKLAVVLGDDEDRTVVDLLAPDLPCFRDPDRILLDGFRRRRR